MNKIYGPKPGARAGRTSLRGLRTALGMALLGGLAFTAPAGLRAQDFGFDTAEPALTLAAPEAGTSLSFGGEITASGRVFPGEAGEALETPLEAGGQASVLVEGRSPAADFTLGLRLSPELLKTQPGRILDRASVTAYLGEALEVQAGLEKLTWGKGDSLRVLDVINPQDYSDFINGELEDRKIAQALVRATLRLGETGKLEAVYVPWFEGDTLPLSGRWMPPEYRAQQSLLRDGFYWGANPEANQGRGNGTYAAAFGTVYGALLASAYQQAYVTAYQTAMASGPTAGNASASAAAAASAADALYTDAAALANLQAQAASLAEPQARQAVEGLMSGLLVSPDTRQLDWAQGGLRWTDSFAGLDVGLQAYAGFLRTPVVDLSPTADPAAFAANPHLTLIYPRVWQGGLDLATAVGPLNLRAEGAYNQTEDWDGTDALLPNPFVNWAAGLDSSWGDLRINLQALGQHTLYEDDADLAHSLITALALTYTLFEGKAELQAAGSWNPFDQDYVLVPSLTLKPADDLSFVMEGKIFGGPQDSRFGAYRDQSFGEVSLRLRF